MNPLLLLAFGAQQATLHLSHGPGREDPASPPVCLDAVQSAKLTASGATLPPGWLAADEFGFSVAVSDDTALFGAPLGTVQTSVGGLGYKHSGVVCIFVRDPDGEEADWREVKRLPGVDSDGAFGSSVTISGDTMVVGATEEEAAGNTSRNGAAFVFERDRGGRDAWGEVAKLVPEDPQSFLMFGKAVSISGDTVVVGAEEDRHMGGAFPFVAAGAAYVYERDHGGIDAWGQVVKLIAEDDEANARFGSSVSVWADTIVVGAIMDDSPLPDAGAAYVFERNEGGPGAWGEVAKLTASDAARQDAFGRSVALCGDTLVVGAYLDDDAGRDSGSAYVFERTPGGPWVEVKRLTASDGAKEDWFGYSVAISGDRIVVGAYPDTNRNGTRAGAAYVFERNTGGTNAWGEVAKLTAADGKPYDSFGYSVAVSGRTILVGAPMDDCDCIDDTPSDWGPIANSFDEGSGYVYGISPSPSTVLTRNEGTNPMSYTASAGVLGGELSGTCDLTTTDHAMAWFFAFDSPSLAVLGGGQSLLCDDGGSGELFSGAGLGPFVGPEATFHLPIPNDASFCGLVLYSQALHLHGAGTFALSNSQDIVIGS